MWDALKNVVTSAKEALGIELPELPGLPVDLAPLADAATGTAAALGQTATDALTEATDTVSTAAEAVTAANDSIREA